MKVFLLAIIMMIIITVVIYYVITSMLSTVLGILIAVWLHMVYFILLSQNYILTAALGDGNTYYPKQLVSKSPNQ